MKRTGINKTANKEKWYLFPAKIVFILALVALAANFSGIGKAEAAPGSGDPLTGFSFSLESGGMNGYFSSCTGLGSENEVVEHKVMTSPGQETVQKIPGRLKWNTVVLKRSITGNKEMAEWRKQVEDGNVSSARKDIEIIYYDQSMTPVAAWNLTNAWLSKINTSIGADSCVMEEVEIVCEGIVRIN
jgi:phage tail-like protein